MLKFLVFDQGRPAVHWPIRNAYLVGSDNSAMRADIAFQDGLVVCSKREAGAAALAIQQPVGECGELTVQTCLLPEREEPYLLNLELARHRLMMLYAKLEDWSLFDLPDDHPVTKRTDLARRLFIESLCHQGTDNAKADKLARDCLSAAVDGSEELALAHAEMLLGRRRTTGQMPRFPLGCCITLEQNHERVRAAMAASFDYVCLPTPWRTLAPEEGEYRWGLIDSWIEWANRSRLPVIAGPVVSFDATILPDWLYIWEHDYETLRDLIYEHIERVVTRYRNAVSVWNVVSGLHLNGHFNLSFDQLMDLTRMGVMLVKKVQPSAKVLVELRQPFGEYFSTNPRSIPPLMYSDLLVQGAIPFDGLAVRLLMGQAQPGQYTRDLLQISNLLDHFSNLGKPVHVGVAAPSEPVTELMIAASDPGAVVDANSGHWRKPWSPLVQSRWLEAVSQIALSKPFVESVAWQEMVDHPNIELPLAGLIGEDLQPKTAFRRLAAFRKNLVGAAPAAGASPQAAAG